MVYTIENIQEGINAKLESMRDGTGTMDRYCILCKKWLLNYPKEVEQNILEWVNNLPLSEVEYHGTSVKRVMQTKKLVDGDFPMVIRNFKMYKDRGFVDGTYICYMDL